MQIATSFANAATCRKRQIVLFVSASKNSMDRATSAGKAENA
jgi:hypothetical protein